MINKINVVDKTFYVTKPNFRANDTISTPVELKPLYDLNLSSLCSMVITGLSDVKKGTFVLFCK